MQTARRLAVLGLTVLSLYLVSSGGRWRQAAEAAPDPGRAGAVAAAVPIQARTPEPTGAASDEPAWIAQAQGATEVLARVMESAQDDEDLRETTIRGGLSIKNETGYEINMSELLGRLPPVRLPAEGPQILIVHTPASEAYTPAGLDLYEANDRRRTADPSCSVVRVGDELAALFEAAGLRVLHDREIYDYPSYTGSYTRTGEAIERCLEQYPDIAVVLDIHRDALGTDGVVYKTMAEEEGVVASQIMLLVGTDESGLSHPNWRANLALALYLQEQVSLAHPTLLRPVSLVPQRYNQHLTGGSLILEVGSSGNTLQEALSAIRLFGEAAAPALAELAEGAGEDSSNS